MNDTNPILSKVRKLLALAEDPAATEHEAEVYTAKATQLIADYGIDRALLACADPASDPVRDRLVTLDAPYAADKLDLLATIAQRLRCTAVQRTRRGDGPRELSLHLFGHASDLERAELLFTSLLLQSATALARTPVPPREHKAAFRRSWLAGFRMAVGRRLDLHGAGAGRPLHGGRRRDGDDLPKPRHLPPPHPLRLRRGRGMGSGAAGRPGRHPARRRPPQPRPGRLRRRRAAPHAGGGPS